MNSVNNNFFNTLDVSGLNCFILGAPPVWPMLEYEMDLVRSLVELGAKAFMYKCTGAPRGCGANISFKSSLRTAVCMECKSRFTNGVRWLEKSDINVNYVHYDDLSVEYKPKYSSFSDLVSPIINSKPDLDALFNNKLGTNWVVESAISTLMSFTNNVNPIIKDNVDVYLRFLYDSYIATLNSRALLENWNIDKFFIFNGRVSRYRPLMRELQNSGRQKDLIVYEHPFRGGDNDRYRYLLSLGGYHHDHQKFSDQLFNQFCSWNVDKNIWISEGNKWFYDRVHSNSHSFKASITKDQINGLLPDSWNPKQFNIVFYTSSEEEWAGIPEVNLKRPFENQLDAISWLTKKLPLNSDLYIRKHPNLSNDISLDQNELIDISYNKIYVIESDSTIDSYALAKSADLIITFGSTISVEAAWLGSTVITLGPAAYSKFEVGYFAYSLAEFEHLLDKLIKKNKKFYVNHRENACKYIFTIKHCEQPTQFIKRKTGSIKQSDELWIFNASLFIKLTVRILLMPHNIKKIFKYKNIKKYKNVSFKEFIKLFKNFFWKDLP